MARHAPLVCQHLETISRQTLEDYPRLVTQHVHGRHWPREQLQQLPARYTQAWRPMDHWTDDQLDWLLEVTKRTRQLAEGTEEEELAVLAGELPTLPE